MIIDNGNDNRKRKSLYSKHSKHFQSSSAIEMKHHSENYDMIDDCHQSNDKQFDVAPSNDNQLDVFSNSVNIMDVQDASNDTYDGDNDKDNDNDNEIEEDNDSSSSFNSTDFLIDDDDNEDSDDDDYDDDVDNHDSIDDEERMNEKMTLLKVNEEYHNDPYMINFRRFYKSQYTESKLYETKRIIHLLRWSYAETHGKKNLPVKGMAKWSYKMFTQHIQLLHTYALDYLKLQKRLAYATIKLFLSTCLNPYFDWYTAIREKCQVKYVINVNEFYKYKQIVTLIRKVCNKVFIYH